MTKKIIGFVLIGLTVCSLGFAEQATPSTHPEDGPTLLGKRYVGLSFSTIDYRTSNANNAIAGDVFADVPVNKHIVLEGGYSLARRSDNGYTGYWNDLFADVTIYTRIKGVKPFVDAGATYSMLNVHGHTLSYHDENGGFGTGAGVEIPITKAMSVSFRAGISEAMVAHAYLFWSESLRGVYWFSPRVAGVGGVGLSEHADTVGAISYSLGARLLF